MGVVVLRASLSENVRTRQIIAIVLNLIFNLRGLVVRRISRIKPKEHIPIIGTHLVG